MDPTVLVFVACACAGMCSMVCVAVALFAWWRRNQPVKAPDFLDWAAEQEGQAGATALECAMDLNNQYVKRVPNTSGTGRPWVCPESHPYDTGITWSPPDEGYFSSSSSDVNANQCAATQACVQPIKDFADRSPWDGPDVKADEGDIIRVQEYVFRPIPPPAGGFGPRG